MKITRKKVVVNKVKRIEQNKPPFPPARFPTIEEIVEKHEIRNAKPDIREFDDRLDMPRLIRTRFRDSMITIREIARKEGRNKAIERARLIGCTGGSSGGGYFVIGRQDGIIAEEADNNLNQFVYRTLVSYARIVDFMTQSMDIKEGIGEESCQSKEKPKLKVKKKTPLKVKQKPKLKVKRLKK